MYHFIKPEEVGKINIVETCDAVAVSDYLRELLKEVKKLDSEDKFVVLQNLDSWSHSECPAHIYKGYQDALCTIYQNCDLLCIERLAVVEAFKEWTKESGFEQRNTERWQRINSRAIREQIEAENRVARNQDFVALQNKDTRDFYAEVFKRAENAS